MQQYVEVSALESISKTQHTAIQQRNFTIEPLGRAELAQQLDAKAKDYGSYLKRANDWVKTRDWQV